MTQSNFKRLHSTWITLALLATTIFIGAPAAEAQTITAFYPVKVVCGFVSGNVPPLAGLNSFINAPPNTDRDQEPGHYATIVNVLHNQFQSNTVQAWYVSDLVGAVSVPLPVASPVGAFQSFDLGCTDIAPLLGLGVGAPFEGWLVLFVTNSSFSVSPVYSYTSQNAFFDHRFQQVNAAGTQFLFLNGPVTVNPFDVFIPGGIANPPIPLPTPGQAGDFESSGAGGLGLGASIDVEVIEAVPLGEPMLAPEVADRMKSLDSQSSK